MNSREKHSLIQGNTWMRQQWLSFASPLPFHHQENKNEHFMLWSRRNLIGWWWFNLACKLVARKTECLKNQLYFLFVNLAYLIQIQYWFMVPWRTHLWRLHDTHIKGPSNSDQENDQLVSRRPAPSSLFFPSASKEWVRIRCWTRNGNSALRECLLACSKQTLQFSHASCRWWPSPHQTCQLTGRSHSTVRFAITTSPEFWHKPFRCSFYSLSRWRTGSRS